jgi:hypothetical protein
LAEQGRTADAVERGEAADGVQSLLGEALDQISSRLLVAMATIGGHTRLSKET